MGYKSGTMNFFRISHIVKINKNKYLSRYKFFSDNNELPEKMLQENFLYRSKLVNLLTKRVMKSGKKALAQKIVYGSLKEIEHLSLNDEERTETPLHVLEKAVRRATP